MELDRATFLTGAGAAALRVVMRTPPASAYVFSRPGGAKTAAGVFGHVGFAYRDGGNYFMCGAIEEAHHNDTPQGKDFWYARTDQPFVRMAAHNNVGVGYETCYDLYKPLYGGGNTLAARRAIAQIVGWRFAAPGHDCLDAVRLVLEAYGIRFNGLEKRTIDPNSFFAMLAGKPVPLNIPWPGSVIDASLYAQYGRQGLRDDIVTFDRRSVIFDDDISYNPASNFPQIAWSSLVVRRGHMVVYNKPQFLGAYAEIRPDATINVKQLPWSYKELGSYVAAAHPFDPARPPIAGISPRFASREARERYIRELQQRPY